jgi:hypothetical protein
MAKRGRPTKEPSAEDRAKVKELLAENSTIAEMARLFGYSAPPSVNIFPPRFLPQKKRWKSPGLLGG